MRDNPSVTASTYSFVFLLIFTACHLDESIAESVSAAECKTTSQRKIDEPPSVQEFTEALEKYAQPSCGRANFKRGDIIVTAEIAYDQRNTVAQSLAYEACRALDALVHPASANKPDPGTQCDLWLNETDVRDHHYDGISCNSVYTWQLPLGSNYRMPLGFGQFRSWVADKAESSYFSEFEQAQVAQLADENQPTAVRNSHPHMRMGNPTLDAIDPSGELGYRMPSEETLLVKPEFAMSYVTQGQTWGPRWVSWHFTKRHIGQQPRGTKEFYPDPDLLRIGAPQLAAIDFAGIGSIVHRGHLCRSNERSAGHRMYTDVYSNIVPQRKRSNSGVWRNLEQTYFDAVESGQWDAFVVAGPVYLERAPFLTFGNVKNRPKAPFPHAIFKIVTLVRPGMGATDITTEAIAKKDVLVYAVVIPNVPTINDLSTRDRNSFYPEKKQEIAKTEPDDYTAELDDAQPAAQSTDMRVNPLEALNFPNIWKTHLPLDFPGDPSKNVDAYRRTTWTEFQVPVWMVESLTGLRFFGAVGRRKLSTDGALALQRALKSSMTPVRSDLPHVNNPKNYEKTLCKELISEGHVNGKNDDCKFP